MHSGISGLKKQRCLVRSEPSLLHFCVNERRLYRPLPLQYQITGRFQMPCALGVVPRKQAPHLTALLRTFETLQAKGPDHPHAVGL